MIPLLLAVTVASVHPPAQLDAARLRTGTFTYRETVDGKSADLSTATVARLPNGTYRFSADIPAFDQSWSTIATRSLAPVATQLRMRTRTGQRYELSLRYAGLKVSGRASLGIAPDGKPASQQIVAGTIAAATVDQRIDWAAVMSTDRQPGESFDFQVYDAKTGLSRVHCEVGDAGIMTTPAGKVHAIRIVYRVYKSSGTEAYAVYTTVKLPRVMLREEMRGNLVITLIGARS